MRPTGLIDPEIHVKPTKGQIDDLVHEIRIRADADQRVLVTTLTKKMAEDLTEYLLELGMRVRYLHSEVDTLERVEILRGLRLGDFDVLVGINLLREGLDLPEVSLVAILDADKEGFLRSQTSLIQTIGRAARNVEGQVIMYADQMTDSMRHAISETNRRRKAQLEYNELHGIDPQTVRKQVTDILEMLRGSDGDARRAAAGAGGGEAASRNGRRCSTSPTCRPTISVASSRRCRTRCTTPPPTSASRRRRVCATRSPSSSGSCAPPSDPLWKRCCGSTRTGTRRRSTTDGGRLAGS